LERRNEEPEERERERERERDNRIYVYNLLVSEIWNLERNIKFVVEI
jgi:hypothetical protein